MFEVERTTISKLCKKIELESDMIRNKCFFDFDTLSERKVYLILVYIILGRYSFSVNFTDDLIPRLKTKKYLSALIKLYNTLIKYDLLDHLPTGLVVDKLKARFDDINTVDFINN